MSYIVMIDKNGWQSMFMKITDYLEKHENALRQMRENLTSYLHMASLLCYEAPLRGNSVIVVAEGASRWVAAWMVAQLRQSAPGADVRLFEANEEAFARYATVVKEMDTILVLGAGVQSEMLGQFLEEAKEKEAKRVVLCGARHSDSFASFDAKVELPASDTDEICILQMVVCGMISDAIKSVVSAS